MDKGHADDKGNYWADRKDKARRCFEDNQELQDKGPQCLEDSQELQDKGLHWTVDKDFAEGGRLPGELEGRGPGREPGDRDSVHREQASSPLELEDKLGRRGGHCRQGAGELRDSQIRTFSALLCSDNLCQLFPQFLIAALPVTD